MAQEYVDFTNDILQKYSFFKDGSFVKLFIKRIKVNNMELRNLAQTRMKSLSATVNVLGQYVLSDPYVVVHFFS